MRIGVVGLSHETNTFAAEQNDSVDCASIQVGEGVLANAHPRGFVGGFIEGTQGSGVELVPTVSIGFAHGGLVSAPLFEHCRDLIVEKLREVQPLDGVYFALHGAMVAEAPYTDAEGCLVREARGVLGDIPMVATYDFHAIMSDEEMASVVPFPNNTNPHIDGYERGLEAAGCLLKMLAGEIAPVTRRVFVPIIGPNIGQSTWSQIPEEERGLLLYDLNLRREELEKTPGIIDITILGGYGYADTPDTGMCIVATADGDAELAERMARQLAGELWRRREQLITVRPVYGIDDGVKEAMSRQEKPVLLVDLGDDPGSACPADSPAVLESLLRLGARDCAVTIRDPQVVAAGLRAGVGATLTMSVGATADRRFYQPVEVSGKVRLIDDGRYMILGPTHGGWGREVSPEAFREANVGPRVVLRLGDKIDVIFSQRRTGKERDFFKSTGIILEEKQIIVVKSNQAHRASFDPVVASTIELDTPGVSTVNYESLPFRYLPRPIWPVDRDMTWEA
jgi:microcystin degradation protein MlrC